MVILTAHDLAVSKQQKITRSGMPIRRTSRTAISAAASFG